VSVAIPDFELLFLVTVRILAALALMPVFGHRSVPAPAKIVLAVSLAWLLVVSGGMPAQPHGVGLAAFLLAIGAEIGLGILLGFAVSLAFWAVTMAGDLVALQMGLGFGGTVHASLEQSSGSVSQFYTIAGTLIFLSIGGHRMLLVALGRTFDAAPPYAFTVGAAQIDRVIQLGTSLFSGAFQIALPIMGTLMLVDAMLAFLSRILPQLNAFIFGMPLKVATGVLVLWISLPALVIFVGRWLSRAVLDMQSVVR